MHPMMYDDNTLCEKVRYNQRIVCAKDSMRKSRYPDILKLSLYGTQRNGNYEDESPALTTESLPDYLVNNRRRMRVCIGAQYQANVSEWTGKAYEVDLKLSGTRIWPLERVSQSRNLIGREQLGKGRPDSFGCQFPGSSESVRFNVSEKRMRLRLELGVAFYLWRFHRMGEETAVSWTKEEENKFQDTWKSMPLSMGSFWEEIVRVLPNKNRVSLVSYYFNVFLLRRRGYQNRASPNNVSSDVDESDSESKDVKPPSSVFVSRKKSQLKCT